MADLTLVQKPSNGIVSIHVIFIHGISGDSFSTWSALKDKKTFWPIWLEEDIPDLAIWTVGYEASISRWHGTAMHIADRATNILERLLNEPDLNNGKEIVLIGHSMGGLIIKQLLRTVDDISHDRKEAHLFVQSVRRIAFLATPHIGSNLATLGNILRIILLPSKATGGLIKNDSNLRDLNYWYRDWSKRNNIHHLILMENQPSTFLGVTVVPVDSADPGLNVRPVMIDADHFSICRPEDKSSNIYINIRSFILRELDTLSEGSLLHHKLDEHTEKLDMILDKHVSYPTQPTDEEINKQLNLIKQSRFFSEFSTEEHTLRLAEQLLNADLSYGSNTTKSFALAWCARLLALGSYREKSIELLKKAKTYGSGQEIDIAEAFLIKATEGFSKGLNKLSVLKSAEAYSASLMMVNNEQDIDMIDWFEKSGLTFENLDPDGKVILIGALFAKEQWNDAIKYVEMLNAESFLNAPVLLHFAALANLVQAVPN